MSILTAVYNKSGMRHKKCESALCRNRFRVTCSSTLGDVERREIKEGRREFILYAVNQSFRRTPRPEERAN